MKAHNYVNQRQTEGRNRQEEIITGIINIPPSIMDTTSREKINKEAVDLNSNIDQKNLPDICRISQPTAQNR